MQVNEVPRTNASASSAADKASLQHVASLIAHLEEGATSDWAVALCAAKCLLAMVR